MYKVKLTRTASKHLAKIDSKFQSAINKAIKKLSQNPHIGTPLVGRLKGFWKLRFSQYRIIYLIQKKQLIIIIFDIRHRKDVYRL